MLLQLRLFLTVAVALIGWLSISTTSAAVISPTESLHHLGCYFLTNPDYVLTNSERQVGDNYDLMPFYRHSMSDKLTPQRCSNFCQTKGMLFAALKQAECSCGFSMDGMRSAETSSLTDQCFERCAGDTSQRCGGANVISVYQAVPAVRTQLPRRCQGGFWTVRLNRSEENQPSLDKITEDRMMWRAADMTQKTNLSRVSLRLCMWKCENLPTCWSVIEQALPGRYVGCVLLDHGATTEAANIRAQSPSRSRQQYGLAQWTCGPGAAEMGDGQPPRQPDSDRLQEAGGVRGGAGGGDSGGGGGGSGGRRIIGESLASLTMAAAATATFIIGLPLLACWQ